MAAKSKYTPEVVKAICQAVRLGASYERAAQAAGITFETLRQWRKSKAAFSDALQKAEGDAVLGWLAKIEKAANEGQWQAAAWKLERRYPAEWGRVDRLELILRQQVTEAAAALGLAPEETTAAVREVERLLKEVRKA